MTLVGSILKQPNEIEDYSINFRARLGANTISSIESATVIDLADNSDVAATILDTVTISGTKILFRLKNGTDGKRYRINIRVILNNGEKIEDEVNLNVDEI